MNTPSTWGPVGLVANREIRARIASKAFRIMTLVMIAVVAGFVVTTKLIGDSDQGSQVGFAPSVSALATPLQGIASAVGMPVTTTAVDPATGEQQVRDGTLDVLVTGTPDRPLLVVKENLSDDLQSLFTVLGRQLALNDQITRLGGDPAAVNAALGAATFPVQPLDPPREFESVRLLLGIIVGILVYISVQLYGQLVAQGVVEEKSSRIVEILLTTIRPWQLMIGKVLGIGAVALSQFVLVVAAGAGAGLAVGAFTFPAAIAGTAIVWAVVWFLLGYLVYALLFASLGALVSRQEDVGSVTAPAITLVVLPYVLGISILPSDPDNKLVMYLSLIPFFSPLLMPMRIALGVAPAWQVALSLVLTVALIAALIWLAGRIYRNAVLRMGSRVGLVEALRG